MKNRPFRLFAILPLALATSALAGTPQISRTEMMTLYFACKADIDTLCSGVESGEGRIAMCLRDHKAEVSPACFNAVTPYLKDQKAD